jgi:hypothetical protein
VNHQNIKEDFEQQINEYYVNYNLFESRENVEHFEMEEGPIDKPPCLIERSKLQSINKVAQDKNFDLSPECKTFFSTLESNSQKCFDEFTQKAKKAQSPQAIAEAAANAARQAAAAAVANPETSVKL